MLIASVELHQHNGFIFSLKSNESKHKRLIINTNELLKNLKYKSWWISVGGLTADVKSPTPQEYLVWSADAETAHKFRLHCIPFVLRSLVIFQYSSRWSHSQVNGPSAILPSEFSGEWMFISIEWCSESELEREPSSRLRRERSKK